MAWLLPRVIRTDQPLSGAAALFATVTSPWNPPGQVPIVWYVAVQVPACPLLGGGLDGGGLDGGGLDGGGLDGGGLLGGALDGGGDVWKNCEKKVQISPDVQVLGPVPVEPSIGLGVWSPSKAAHWTG